MNMAAAVVLKIFFQCSIRSFHKHVVNHYKCWSKVKLLGRSPNSLPQKLYPVFLQTANLRLPARNAVHLKLSEQEVVDDTNEESEIVTKDIISKVNQQIEERSHGRLFAVVHVCGKQFKITDEDLIVLEGYWPPAVGDKLKLDKILLAGGSDFTLIGRPILPPDLVSVKATVIEKSLSHTKTHFRKKRRHQYMRINFYRSQYTMLRINSIEITGKVNEKKDVEGIDGRIF